MDGVGVAQDAKGGAVVVVGGAVIYLEGVGAWPDGAVGAAVRVQGARVLRRQLPEATVGDDGAVSQGAAPGSEQEVVLAPETELLGFAPPWSLRYDDGSHNVLDVARATVDAPVTWSYAPMTPARSSSGVYSGGDPAEGALPAAAGFALWGLVQAAEKVASDGGARPMGTGELRVTEGGEVRTWRLSMAADQALRASLASWRSAP